MQYTMIMCSIFNRVLNFYIREVLSKFRPQGKFNSLNQTNYSQYTSSANSSVFIESKYPLMTNRQNKVIIFIETHLPSGANSKHYKTFTSLVNQIFLNLITLGFKWCTELLLCDIWRNLCNQHACVRLVDSENTEIIELLKYICLCSLFFFQVHESP